MPAFCCPSPKDLLSVRLLSFRRSFIATVLYLTTCTTVYAQTEGITVGQPKVYDNQSLAIMLDELNARLRQIQVIDQASLVKALGLQQGSQQQDISREFDVSVSLTPAAAVSGASSQKSPDSGALSSSTAGETTSSNPSSGSNSKSSKSSTDKSASPAALPDLIAPPSYKPEYGESAGDLLSDQIDLTYQIFNLRMLLERSITDRLKDDKPRRQAVIGFNITLDPPSTATDAAAYVEITLTSSSGPVALVASMPQEKTYNASALSSSSTAFGGAAVVKILTLGYNQRKRSQTFFLYRDSDTLAIERPAAEKSVTFGWVFRPVLGRRSVNPGMRQMFAVIALPETDVSDDKAAAMLSASAKTYWLHYDKNTSTTLRHPGFWDWSAKNLPKESTATFAKIEVPPTAPVETSLQPSIGTVQLLQTTNGITVLQIQGENFYPGTTVTIGDKTYRTQADGLFIKSSQSMTLTANTDVLSRSLSAVVNGRYGASVPLYAASRSGITILPRLIPVSLKFSDLQVAIRSKGPASSLTKSQINDFPRPLVLLNGSSVPYLLTLEDEIETTKAGQRGYILATVRIPNSLLHARDNQVAVIFPLLGEPWYSEAVIYDDTGVQVTRISGGKATTLLISRPGIQFDGNWRLLLDTTYDLRDGQPPRAPTPKDPTPTSFTRLLQCKDDKDHKSAPGCYAVRVVADTKFLADYKKLILITDTGYIETIDVPSASAVPDKPTALPRIVAVSPIKVGLNEVLTINVTGSGLDAIKQVTFEGKPLTFWEGAEKSVTSDSAEGSTSDEAKTKGNELHILLSRDVTGKEGHQELLLQVDSKTMLTIAINVAPAPTATRSENKTPQTTKPATNKGTKSP